jgi:phosphomevalonate kinase
MIIGISGKQRSGKDSVAELITKKLEGRFKRYGLADGIKAEYSRITGIPIEYIDVLKNSIPQVRKQLIYLGQVRKLDNIYYWVEQLSGMDNIVVPDIRYLCEIDHLSNNQDFIKVRVECPREVRIERGTLSNEDHSSEIELDGYTEWNYVMDNSGDKRYLEDQVTDLLKQINLM